MFERVESFCTPVNRATASRKETTASKHPTQYCGYSADLRGNPPAADAKVASHHSTTRDIIAWCPTAHSCAYEHRVSTQERHALRCRISTPACAARQLNLSREVLAHSGTRLIWSLATGVSETAELRACSSLGSHLATATSGPFYAWKRQHDRNDIQASHVVAEA